MQQSPEKPIAAIIGTIFGGLWAFIGAMALPHDWHLITGTAVGLATVALVATLWTGKARPAGRQPLFSRRPYQVAVAAELITIYAASLLLPRIGLQSYFIQIVGIIVGLHFLGLWMAARSARFIVIVVGMCGISMLAMLCPQTLDSVHLRDLITGGGNALVLWICARPARILG